MAEKLPSHFSRFKAAQPEICQAFEELGRRVHERGSLSERERRLVKLGIAIGVGTEGGVHSAVRHALRGGCGDGRRQQDVCGAPARNHPGFPTLALGYGKFAETKVRVVAGELGSR
jgi:carboxymuconolactone decarboxylase family protein